MRCPPGEASATTERQDRTAWGDRRVRCRDCRRGWHERTGTPFHRLQAPTAVVWLVGLGRCRAPLSRRDVAEMLRQRGLICTHAAVRDGESPLAPVRSETLRQRRDSRVGTSG